MQLDTRSSFAADSLLFSPAEYQESMNTRSTKNRSVDPSQARASSGLNERQAQRLQEVSAMQSTRAGPTSSEVGSGESSFNSWTVPSGTCTGIEEAPSLNSRTVPPGTCAGIEQAASIKNSSSGDSCFRSDDQNYSFGD